MFARRLTGALIAMLMLHLTFLGADTTCAEHGSHPANAHQHGSSHGNHVVAPSHTTVNTTNTPCETPTQPECCRAMTSCAVNAASEGTARVAQLPPVHSVIEAAVMRLPRSQVTSPDPPPPKA